jgi:hypothetical protein
VSTLIPQAAILRHITLEPRAFDLIRAHSRHGARGYAVSIMRLAELEAWIAQVKADGLRAGDAVIVRLAVSDEYQAPLAIVN